MEVAREILRQLGGNRFCVMVGAKNLVGGENRLSFKVGRNSRKVTHVRITLDPTDTYTVETLAIRGTKCRTLNTVSGVYCDMLAEIFEAETGLYTKF